MQYKKENHPKSSQIRSYGIFSKGLKNEFKTAVLNEPSAFEPLKVDCSCKSDDGPRLTHSFNVKDTLYFKVEQKHTIYNLYLHSKYILNNSDSTENT